MKTSDYIRKYESIQPDFIQNIEIMTLNVTTPSQEDFNLINEDYISPLENKVTGTYGSGSILFTGEGSPGFSKFSGSRVQNSKTTHLIHAESGESCRQLSNILKKHRQNLQFSKVSFVETAVVVRLENEVFTQNLFNEFVTSARNPSRIYISMTTNNVLEIGKPSSSKYIRIFVQKTNSGSSFLVVVSKFKDAASKQIQLLNSTNLGLDEIQLVFIREVVTRLNSGELKTLLLTFLESKYSLPSIETLKQRIENKKENSKVRYLKSAFNTTFTYLADASLKKEVTLAVESFIKKYNEGKKS